MGLQPIDFWKTIEFNNYEFSAVSTYYEKTTKQRHNLLWHLLQLLETEIYSVQIFEIK